jgi:hypothetical protein
VRWGHGGIVCADKPPALPSYAHFLNRTLPYAPLQICRYHCQYLDLATRRCREVGSDSCFSPYFGLSFFTSFFTSFCPFSRASKYSCLYISGEEEGLMAYYCRYRFATKYMVCASIWYVWTVCTLQSGRNSVLNLESRSKSGTLAISTWGQGQWVLTHPLFRVAAESEF